MFRCLVFLLCALVFPCAAFSHETSEKVIVGFLQTAEETYPEELTFSYNISEMLAGLGSTIVRIDYNTITDFAKVMEESLAEANGDKSAAEKIADEKIKSAVLDFININGISRIFIPGNFYNVDTEPFAPTENRQLVTNAITSIVRENPKIRLMGVCGGLQGIMHALGVKVTRVHNLLNSHRSVASHVVSMPDPHDRDVPLHRLRIVPGSRLADIVSKYITADVNGWFNIFFPDAHGGVVSNDQENMKKLEELGYRVVGFSDDGTIEALEDPNGNILFQDHPEALAIGILKGEVFPLENSSQGVIDQRYRAALAAIAIMKDFLYH